MKMPMEARKSRIVIIQSEILNIGRVCTVIGVGMILDFKFQILDFRFQISDFRFQISDFRFQILDFGFWILDFGGFAQILE